MSYRATIRATTTQAVPIRALGAISHCCLRLVAAEFFWLDLQPVRRPSSREPRQAPTPFLRPLYKPRSPPRPTPHRPLQAQTSDARAEFGLDELLPSLCSPFPCLAECLRSSLPRRGN